MLNKTPNFFGAKNICEFARGPHNSFSRYSPMPEVYYVIKARGKWIFLTTPFIFVFHRVVASIVI